MSLVQEWSVRLAQEVAPDEAAMANYWAEAYAQGGKARKQLTAKTSGGVAGFDAAGLFAVIPVVLNAVAVAGPAVLSLLVAASNTAANPNAAKLLDCIKSTLSVVEIKLRSDGVKRSQKAPHAASLVPTDAGFAPLIQAINQISAELRAAGMDATQSDAVTLRVLKVLLSEPLGAQDFVQQIGAKP